MKLSLLIFLGLVLGEISCKAVSPFYTTYKQLTIQDGLVDNTVLSIHKDAKGLMWLGTTNGLSKYDGNRFSNYTLNPDFTMNVYKIEEDNRHILYLQTNDWITYMDCKDESTGRLHTLVQDRIYQVTDFLLPNDSTLLACDETTLSLFHIALDPYGHPVAQLEKVYPFELEVKERFMKFGIPGNHEVAYLVTNRARVLVLDMGTGRILKQKQLLTTKNEFGASSISYHNGRLFISSLLHGIFIMDDSLENICHIKNQENAVPGNLSHNDVYNITYISDSCFLAATWSGYTMLYADSHAPGGWTTEVIANEPTWQSLNFEIRMISSYYDPNGFLWIGTHGGGVLVSDWKWNFIRQYNFQEDNEVESMVVDEKERIYLSTYEQGVFYSDKSSGGQYDFVLRELPQTDRKTVLCSMKDRDGTLWFGRKDGLILRYSPLNGEVQKLKAADSPINVLFTDSKDNFWMGTENGLFLYNRNDGNKKRVDLEQEVNTVLDIDEDSEGNLWIATSLRLLKLNYSDEQQHIQHYSTARHTYTAQTVLAAKDGTVYVGYKNGLGIVPRGETAITHVFTTDDGLGSNWIHCLLEDEQGYIWIGTNSGFSCYDKSINQFFNYYISGSSRSVAFWGDVLCWGGNKHMLFFSPQEAIRAFKADADNQIIITGIEVGNKPLIPGKPVNEQMILTKSPEYVDYISLSHENRDFSLSFNSSPHPATRTYLYRLMPYQSEWIECKSNEKISYANLSPETYTFQIKNKSSVNDEDITSLKIDIQPHWTQTWAFRIFLLIACIGCIYYMIFTLKRKHQRVQLIAELEHGIAIYKLQHQQEIKSKEDRNVFFTKAAQELHPLLALILSPLEKLLNSMEPDNDSYSSIILIRKNVHLLYKKVDQLLGMEDVKTSDGNEEEGGTGTVSSLPGISNGVKQGKQYIFMQKVINAIEDNIANENFSVTMLADMLCMSPPTLYRKTKEHFHLTVTEVIRKIRMNKAASLLAMQKYSISEITEMVGYNDYETFRKHFKSQFGVSASKYVDGGKTSEGMEGEG